MTTRGDIVKAAGFKQNFDYALPEMWVNELPTKEAMDIALRWYVWGNDGEHRVWGHPVDLRTLLEQIKTYVRKTLLEA